MQFIKRDKKGCLYREFAGVCFSAQSCAKIMIQNLYAHFLYKNDEPAKDVHFSSHTFS